ncbi:MAG: SDR family oxidoreductase [Halanaerobiales bacterium]|nr:SDR family oxidoreductase [Halanaerobiales bacterium]
MKNIALVTGGSSGIGLGIVKKFLEENWQVIVLDIHPLPDSVCIENCSFLKVNINNEDEVKKCFSSIGEVYKKIDAVINSAGIIENSISLDSLECEKFEQVIKTNLVGSFMICKYGLSFLKNSKRASIVNIGSISGVKKASNYLAYAASKSGLYGLTMSLAKQLAPNNIRVNMLSPGSVVDTGLWEKQYGREITFLDKAQLLKQTPLKRLNDPKAIADVVYFLSSEEAKMITGVNVTADGGVTL